MTDLKRMYLRKWCFGPECKLTKTCLSLTDTELHNRFSKYFHIYVNTHALTEWAKNFSHMKKERNKRWGKMERKKNEIMNKPRKWYISLESCEHENKRKNRIEMRNHNWMNDRNKRCSNKEQSLVLWKVNLRMNDVRCSNSVFFRISFLPVLITCASTRFVNSARTYKSSEFWLFKNKKNARTHLNYNIRQTRQTSVC